MAEVKVKVKPKSVQKVKPVKAGRANSSHGLVPSKSIVNYPQTKDLLASDFIEECPFKRLGLLSSPSV